MDKKDPIKNLDPQIAANLGGRTVVKADLNPRKTKMPTPGQQGTGKGTPPPYPLVPLEEIHKYTKEGPRKPEEVFGLNQAGKFDPELNEFALKEIADLRGISVEQLLADKKLGKKLDKKVEPAMENKMIDTTTFNKQLSLEPPGSTIQKPPQAPQAPPAPVAPAPPDSVQMLELQRQEIELKIQMARSGRSRGRPTVDAKR